jgi:hypothetical protein
LALPAHKVFKVFKVFRARQVFKEQLAQLVPKALLDLQGLKE